MIPLIRRIVVNVRARHRLATRKEDAARLLDEGATEQREALQQTARRLRHETKGYVAELEQIGCFLRDPEGGVVECYGDVDGEIVYLTWHPGHDDFLYWHPLDQSFINTQPLPGLDLPKAREAAE